MGPVVLHLQQGQAPLRGHGLGLPGGKIVGVQVAGQGPGHDAEQPQLGLEGGAVVVQGLGVFQIADVLAEKDVAVPPGGKARLLLGPQSQHPVGGAVRHDQRLGGVAPAAAEKTFPPLPDRHKGIVAAVHDGAVVEQVAVCDPLQPGQGLVVAGHHGAAGQVGAGQDQRRRAAGAAVRQQDMERGVGQQDAEAAVLAQAGKARCIRPLFQQDDGPPGALQQGGFVLRDKAELPRRVQIAAEDGQGLFGAALAAAQAEDGRLVPGVAGQVDAAGPFDRDRPACGQGPLGQGDGVAGQGPARIVQIKGPGPAGGAAVGLGVVAAAAQVGVFGGAAAAHGKPGHGGIGPVVGQGPQDGKAGPAVGAVDERIAVPPAGRVGHFPQAGGAGGQVGGGQGGRAAGGAGQDGKGGLAPAGGQGPHRDLFHHGQGRRPGAQGAHERLDGVGRALQLQLHPGGGVAGPAAQAQPGREPVEERPEPHPLHDAGHKDVYPAGAGLRPARHGCARPDGRPAGPAPRRCGPTAGTAGPGG